MYCWNTEGIFRLIQSVPSPKAEPFKRWLAKPVDLLKTRNLHAKAAKFPEKQELTLSGRLVSKLSQERTTLLNPSQKRKLEESDKIFMKKK